MTTTSAFRSAGAVALALFVALSGAAPAQNPPKKDPDPEVAERLKLLDEVVADKKFARDAEGVGVVDALYQKHEAGMHEKDEKDVLKGLDAVLNKGKVRPKDQTQLYVATAALLGRFGPDGAKVLRKAYEGKRFPDRSEWVPLREKLLLNVGKTKDESCVKFLLDEARRNPEAALQAAAGEALGNFEESKEKLRKEIVSDLLVKYGSLAEIASQLGTNIEAQNAKDRLAALSGKWNDTLKKLTGQNFDTFREWQDWHNDNKNKPW